MSSNSVILHIDLDCFFVQVERHRDASLVHRPVALMQHEDIISVSYEARACGVRKHMPEAQARALCPAIALVQMPRKWGSKVTYQSYKQASDQVFGLIERRLGASVPTERASIDEAYFDVTALLASRALQDVDANRAPASSPSQHLYSSSSSSSSSSAAHSQPPLGAPVSSSTSELFVVGVGSAGSSVDTMLRRAADLAAQLRAAVFDELGYTSSAGIAAAKLVAKLASAAHKPHAQTLVFPAAAEQFLRGVALTKLPRLKLALRLAAPAGPEAALAALADVTYVGDLLFFSQQELAERVGARAAEFLYNAARGLDDEPVRPSGPPRSLSSSMTLQHVRHNESEVRKILSYIVGELVERQQADTAQFARAPQTYEFAMRLDGATATSRSFPSTRAHRAAQGSDIAAALCASALEIFRELTSHTRGQWVLRWICVSATRFAPLDSAAAANPASIRRFFLPAASGTKTGRDSPRQPAAERASSPPASPPERVLPDLPPGAPELPSPFVAAAVPLPPDAATAGLDRGPSAVQPADGALVLAAETPSSHGASHSSHSSHVSSSSLLFASTQRSSLADTPSSLPLLPPSSGPSSSLSSSGAAAAASSLFSSQVSLLDTPSSGAYRAAAAAAAAMTPTQLSSSLLDTSTASHSSLATSPPPTDSSSLRLSPAGELRGPDSAPPTAAPPGPWLAELADQPSPALEADDGDDVGLGPELMQRAPMPVAVPRAPSPVQRAPWPSGGVPARDSNPCPVCNAQLPLDLAAAAMHIAGHFDGNGDAAPAVSRRRAVSPGRAPTAKRRGVEARQPTLHAFVRAKR